MKKNQIITLLFLLSAFLTFAQVDGNTKLEVRNDSLIISYKVDLSGISVGNGLVQENASTRALAKEDAWKVFINNSSTDHTYTIPDQTNGAFTEDIAYTFWSNGTGKIFVKGQTGAGVSPREISEAEKFVTTTRFGSDNWIWSSGTLPWSGCNPVVGELNIGPNAASDSNCNESNQTSGFIRSTATGLMEAVTDSYVGEYAVKFEIEPTGSGVYYGSYTLTEVTAGDIYYVSLASKSTQGTARLTAWANCTGGPNSVNITDQYITYDYTITATNSANIGIRFYAGYSSVTGFPGDNIFIDNLSIIKL